MSATDAKRPIPIRMRSETQRLINDFRKEEMLDTMEDAIVLAITRARGMKEGCGDVAGG